MSKLSWQARLTGLIALVLGAMLLFQLLYVLPYVRDREVQQEQTHQEEITRNIARELDSDMARIEDRLTRIANLTEFQSMDIAAQQSIMEQHVEISLALSWLYVLDAEGWFVSGTTEDLSIYQTKSYADRTFFTVPFEQGETYFKPAAHAFDKWGIVSEEICVPIQSETGERVGILLGNLRLNEAIERVADYPIEEGMVACVVDREGSVVAHSDIDLFALEEGPLSLDYSSWPMVQAVIAGETGVSKEYEHDGRSYFGTYAVLESNGWAVVVGRSRSLVLAEADALTRRLLAANAILFAIALVISLLLSRQIMTRERKAQEALRESEEKWRSLAANAPNLILIVDSEGTIEFINRTLPGFTVEEAIGSSVYSFVQPEHHDTMKETIRRVFKAGEPGSCEITGFGPNRRISWYATQVGPIWSAGRVAAAVLIVLDVTERKNAEQEARYQREYFKSLFDGSPEAVVSVDMQRRATDVNPAFEKLFGYALEDIKDKDMHTFILPQGKQREGGDIFRRAIQGEIVAKETVRRAADGREIPVSFLGAPVIVEGKQIGTLGIYRDISERKRAEERLRESEEAYRSLFEQSMDAIALVAVDGTIMDANPAYLNMYGYDVADIGRANVKGQYLRATDRDKYVRRMEQRGAIRDEEVKLKKVDGTIMDCLLTSNAVRDETGRIVRFQTVVRDITEDKRRKDALADELTRRRILLEQSRDGIVVLDQDGKVAEANLSFAQMLGYSPEELHQLHVWDWDFSFPPDTLTEMLRTVDESGDHFETRHRRKDGTVYDVEISTNGAVFAGHKLIFCVCRDITERKKAEEELESSRDELRRLATQLQLVREEERAAVAWELHDEVGQALAALQIDLHWLERRLSKDDTELLEKTQSMSRLIQSNTERLRRLYMELRPGMLDDLGLAPTIEWQAEEFQKRTGIKSVLSLDQNATPRGAGCSLAVYRVFQEALSNVARHAEATEVNISLTKTDDRIVLEIADNGRGITREQVSAPGSSGLVGMRERLHPWGGEVKITGVRGKGTTVRASIPVGKGEL